jgi:hypothetical protein
MRRFSIWVIFSIFFLTVMFSVSLAQPVVVGEGIRFSPSNPKPGQMVFMDIRFRVEGTESPIPIDFSIVEGTGTPDSSHPTLSGRTFASSTRSYTITAGHTIPDPIPPRPTSCFNVYAHFPGTGLRSALLIHNACLGAQIRLSNPGIGQRVTFVRGGPPGTPPSPSIIWEGRGVEFSSKNLNYGDSSIHLLANINVEGSFPTLSTHIEISIVRKDIRWSYAVNGPGMPGHHRVELAGLITESILSRFFPSKLDYDVNCLHYNIVYEDEYRRYSVDRSSVSVNPLIKDISLETRMYILSEGTGQRITLPGSRKVAPTPPGVKPARPGL